MDNMTFHCQHYNELDRDTLYELLALRSEVFIMEQHALYQDPDGYDRDAFHIWAEDAEGEIVGCARILPPGVKLSVASIGRYALAKKARGSGIGRALFGYAIEQCEQQFNVDEVHIIAQAYLQKLYESFGFIREGDAFDEAGIEHYYMIRRPAA